MKHLTLTALALAALISPASAQEMTTIFVAEYQAGPNWIADKPMEEQDLGGHFQMIGEAFATGTLRAFGPTMDDFHGQYLWAVGAEKAREIVDADPGLANDVLSEVSLTPWHMMIDNLGAETGDDQLYWLNYHPGPSWQDGRPLAEQDLDAHMAYVGALAQGGTLLAGGPVSEVQGRYVVAAADDAAASALVASDPAVQAGLFEVQIKPWAPIQRK